MHDLRTERYTGGMTTLHVDDQRELDSSNRVQTGRTNALDVAIVVSVERVRGERVEDDPRPDVDASDEGEGSDQRKARDIGADDVDGSSREVRRR